MVEFYEMIAITVLNIALPYFITRGDRIGLRPVERARAWNTASWASAVYFFGPLCLPAHFWVTRRTVRGFLTGGAWMAAILGVESLLALALDTIFGGG